MCLSTPEKDQFVNLVQQAGGTITFCNTNKSISERIARSDIVQLEFWNHPTIMAALCCAPLPQMRLIVWCHVSGTYFPIIPIKLLSDAHIFLFTSACSYKTAETSKAIFDGVGELGIVSSGGGMNGLPKRQIQDNCSPLRYGYAGTTNFAKLHPDIVDGLSSVSDASFRVRLIGDGANRKILEKQCRENNQSNLLEFRGYTDDIEAELKNLDVMIYLLNPEHYGTSENALLEGMAMGVVPIVLKNAAECEIVEDRVTGLCLK